MKSLRILVGIGVWALLVGTCFSYGMRLRTHEPTVESLRQYWMGHRSNVTAEFGAPVQIAIGDPIYLPAEDGELRKVGEVLDFRGRIGDTSLGRVKSAEMMLYPSTPTVGEGSQLVFFQASDSVGWVVETLLTEQRKADLYREIQRALDEHQAALMAAIKPLVEQSMEDAVWVVQDDIGEVVNRHLPKLQALGNKYQREIVEEDLVPLVREEIWPIVQTRVGPTAHDVGREMWERFSLWRFGWRYVYDKSPLPNKKLTEKEWTRFLEREAVPILEKRTDEFMKVVQAVVADIARNPQSREFFSQSLRHVATDPEFRELIWEIVDELVLRNDRLHRALQRNWTGPEARDLYREVTRRLEPSLRRVTNQVFGSLQTGITPEFAEVLRTQILRKDRRWFMLQLAGEPVAAIDRIPVVLASESQPAPFEFTSAKVGDE